jgi:chromosome partitioning protein
MLLWYGDSTTMILVCGGIKGGSGKTTMATNLAAMRAGAGKDMLLVDADEQESATIFTAIRKRDQSERPQYTSIILRESQVRAEIDRMRLKYDDVIVDTGGRDTRAQRASLSLADVLLLPFNPRSLDIWTIENVEKLLKDMRTISPELRAVSFLNRADPVGSDNEDSREILSAVAGIEFAGLTIVNRKAFGKAVALGLSVTELNKPDEKAAREIVALYKYLFSTKSE